jgi:DNA polymerase-3 subunit alpha
MRRYLKELGPTTFSDLAAMVALYRPGPKEHIPSFIRAKHGLEPIQYPHPVLSGILEETYGVIVYQDQVLFIVQAFAGYSLGEADIVRKAMGKKIPQIMRKERERFIKGAKLKGFSSEVAQEVFNLIEPFAGYAFNKAHSVSYAMIAYQNAYLKANYTIEYIVSLLMTNTGQQEKVAAAVAECHRLGIVVLPPDVNKSDLSFSIEHNNGEQAIRFGLADIKNVGTNAITPIIDSRREGGVFKSIEDLCRRVDLRGISRRVIESLIKAGAMDSLNDRGALLQNIDRIMSLAQREQKLRETGQSTMFDLWGESVPMPLPSLEMEAVSIPQKEKLIWEKGLLGVYLSEHPFAQVARQLVSDATALCGQIDNEMVGQTVIVAGTLTSVRQLTTKNQRPFAASVLEDLTGSIEVTCWPEVYQRTEGLWAEENILLVQGKVKARGDSIQLVCEHARQYHPDMVEIPPEVQSQKPRQMLIKISQTENEQNDLGRFHRILEIVKGYIGQDEVHLVISTKEGAVNLEMPNLKTMYCQELHEQLAELIGEEGFVMGNSNN